MTIDYTTLTCTFKTYSGATIEFESDTLTKRIRIQSVYANQHHRDDFRFRNIGVFIDQFKEKLYRDVSSNNQMHYYFDTDCDSGYVFLDELLGDRRVLTPRECLDIMLRRHPEHFI